MADCKKNVLIVVTADPRANGRVAEAIRIATGVGGWDKVNVQVCLCGEARRVLADDPDDLVNGDVIGAYLPLLRENHSALHVLREEGEEGADGFSMTVDQLAAVGREMDSVLRF